MVSTPKGSHAGGTQAGEFGLFARQLHRLLPDGRACRMASKKLPADFKAEADTLAQNIRVYASTARETPLQLADVVIDEVRGYYWRESKWTTR